MSGIADTVVGHAALGEVVGAYLCRAVACRYKTLTTTGNIVHILLVLLIIDKGIEAREGTLLVLGLVARLGTLDEDFLCLTSIGVLPHIAQTDTRLHLVHVLTTST